MFKYEMHVHSVDVSPCASATAEDLVARFTEKGYTGINLTNHWNPGVFKSRGLTEKNAEELAEYYLNGYRRLKEAAGDKLDIFCGMELAMKGSANDYLVYGVTREMLLELGPYFGYGKREDVIKIVHSHGGLIFHAHPFRKWMTVFPDQLYNKEGEPYDPDKFDGIEGINYGSNDRYSNDMALDWSEHYKVRNITGSDYHNKSGRPYGGVFLPRRAKDMADFVDMVRRGEYALSRMGYYWWGIGEFHPKSRFKQ